MATIGEVSLGRVLEVLRPSLTSVEIRAVGVEIDHRWELAAGVLIASRISVDDLRAMHRDLLNQDGLPSLDQFEVVLDALPLAELDAILSDLDNGIFGFNGRTFYLADQDNTRPWAPIMGQQMSGSHAITLEPESGIFPRYTCSLRTRQSPEDVFKQAGIEPSDLGLSAWWELNEFMGLAFFSNNQASPMRLGLAVTVYAAFDPIPTIRDGAAHVSLHAHRSLQPKLTVRGRIRRDTTAYPSPSRLLPIPSSSSGNDVQQIALEMPVDLGRLNPNDYVEFQMFHKDLGQLNLGRPSWAYPTQLRAIGTDPLLDALQHFDGGQHVGEYLSRTRQATPQSLSSFEAGVLLTFSAVNLRYAPLMVYREAEHMRDQGREIGSADIVAFDFECGLLVIDCTSNVPTIDKIQKLRNTVQALGKRISTPIRGVIVCASDVALLRQDSARYGIDFVDASQLQAIWDIARSGNTALALNHLRQIVQFVPAVGQL